MGFIQRNLIGIELGTKKKQTEHTYHHLKQNELFQSSKPTVERTCLCKSHLGSIIHATPIVVAATVSKW
jgi:hypothetical protein